MKTVQRVNLKHAQFYMVRQVLQGRKIYFIAGTHSLFVPSKNIKYIMSHRPDGQAIVRDWEDENGNLVTMTPSEAARTELKKTFPGLHRVGWQSASIKLFDWRWPMLYTGSREGHGSYIDLSGAYHQLYSRLWLDVAFPCGYGTLSLKWIADRLADWKAARNSLIGITAAREITGVLGYRSIPLKTHNPYLAPHLWATIQAILNEIAFQAELRGAIYIATDGYIFPSTWQAEDFEELLCDWGLKYRKVSGHYEIKGWGCYRARGKKTKTFEKANVDGSSGFRAINLFDSEYPTRLTRWWSKSIPHYSAYKYQAEIKEQWITS